MKRLTLTLFTLAITLSFSACDQRFRARQKPVPGPKPVEYGTPSDLDGPPSDGPAEVKKRDEIVDPNPVRHNDKIPPPPTPNNPEYAIKVEGKAGYVKSPYDGQGRLIDVRGLPPGTEAECPYTRRTFLVPP